MNTYTIKEMREKFDIPSSTLRYYDDTGLFPAVSPHRSKPAPIHGRAH